MASFYRRGKTWSFKMEVGKDKDGKRLQDGEGGFRTKKEAEEAAAEMQVELSLGTYRKESEISFRVFSESWLKAYSVSVKKNSARIRRHEINCLCYYFDAIKLKEITKKQYQDALTDLIGRGYAKNTISGIHGTAKMLFKKAIELDVIKNNPTQYARPPRKLKTLEDIENSNYLPKYLEKEDLANFLQTANNGGLGDDYSVFLLLAYTGMRVGELCVLKWSDVDFNEHTISITKTYYSPKNNMRSYELQPPKTKASIRKVDISSKVIKELESLQSRQKVIKMKKRDIWHDHNFVFTLEKYPGYPLNVERVENRMTRILKLAGLNSKLTPHSLRHTHTSLLAEAGVGLEEIMHRLGHTDDTTTRQVYLHVTKGMKKEAARKFDALMDNL